MQSTMGENKKIGWTPRAESALQAVYLQMIALGIPCERSGKPNATAIIQYALEQAAKAGKKPKWHLRNTALEQQVAQAITAQAQQCHENCERAIRFHDFGATMVIGTALFSDGPPIAHAWLEMDGEIVDPTYFVSGLSPIDYAPDVRYTKADIDRIIEREGFFYLTPFDRKAGAT